MKQALFVCVHNSGRSQMAEAVFNHLAQGRARAESAGTIPGDAVQPEVIQVMAELGLDLRSRRPKVLTEEQAARADRTITMGCSTEACPVFIEPGADWGLTDPRGLPVEEVRRVRDEVIEKVSEPLREMRVPVPEEPFGARTGRDS